MEINISVTVNIPGMEEQKEEFKIPVGDIDEQEDLDIDEVCKAVNYDSILAEMKKILKDSGRRSNKPITIDLVKDLEKVDRGTITRETVKRKYNMIKDQTFYVRQDLYRQARRNLENGDTISE